MQARSISEALERWEAASLHGMEEVGDEEVRMQSCLSLAIFSG